MKVLMFLMLALPVSIFSQSVAHKIDTLIDGYYQKKEFNGTVLVAVHGEIIYEKAWGYADVEKAIPNKISTRFLIGSTTKSFTAVSIMQLVDQGNLDLHRSISYYLPDLKKELGDQLTLHLLLKMSSGLPVHLNRVVEMKYEDLSEEKLVEIINTCPLSFEPGSRYEYSNLNYQLCAAVLAKVSGKSFKDFLTQHSFLPLKMTDSGVERSNDLSWKKARGYEVKDRKLFPASRNYMGYALGSGDMYATARDLLKWDQALYGNVYLSESAKQELFNGHPEQFGGYGYGFKVKHYLRRDGSQGKLVRHGGSMRGFVSNVHRYLDDQLTIIVLGNIRPYPIMEITTAIEQLVLSSDSKE